jgi:hypothetical protein
MVAVDMVEASAVDRCCGACCIACCYSPCLLLSSCCELCETSKSECDFYDTRGVIRRDDDTARDDQNFPHALLPVSFVFTPLALFLVKCILQAVLPLYHLVVQRAALANKSSRQ